MIKCTTTTNSRWLCGAFALALAALACGGVDGTEIAAQPFAGDEGQELEQSVIGSSQQALWSLGSNSWYHEWDSGDNHSLSGFEDVPCVTNYGPDHVVAELRGFKETGSLDNYLARLEATCREYDSTANDTYTPIANSDQTETVFTSNYRTPGVTRGIPFATGTVPVGVRLRVNGADYVKDLRLIYELTNGNVVGPTNYYSGWVTDYGGTEVTLECSNAAVMTGVAVNYSTDTGKIRAFRIYCREIDHS